eukprot:m.134360 g.134360  ORF g.134360 m.134360 type:complete len:335 (-) comp9566_c0_seq1:116-1120(-)
MLLRTPFISPSNIESILYFASSEHFWVLLYACVCFWMLPKPLNYYLEEKFRNEWMLPFFFFNCDRFPSFFWIIFLFLFFSLLLLLQRSLSITFTFISITVIMSEGGRFKLGYWDIRGLGGCTRMFLWYIGEKDFENKVYAVAKYEEWFGQDKPNMGLDFPNLPFLFDNKTGVKLTQSLAILHYLAHTCKHELFTVPDEFFPYKTMVEGQYVDLNKAVVNISYNSKTPEEVEAFVNGKLKTFLELFEKWFAKKERDGPFLFGALHFLDFALAEEFKHCQLLFDGCTKDFPAINSYVDTFFGLDEIKECLQSDKFISYPVNSLSAYVNCSGTGESK